MAKRIGDRIRFRLIPAPWNEQRPGGPMKTLPGKREIMIDWGASSTSIGYCERGTHGEWRASPDEGRCRGLQHIFDATEIERSGPRMGEVLKAVRDAVNASQTAMEAQWERARAQMLAQPRPRAIAISNGPLGNGTEGMPSERKKESGSER